MLLSKCSLRETRFSTRFWCSLLQWFILHVSRDSIYAVGKDILVALEETRFWLLCEVLWSGHVYFSGRLYYIPSTVDTLDV